MTTCPSCAAAVPDGFAFCGRCGAALGAAEAATSHEERKVVSILFCDLVGFTAASEAADPEDVRARIRPYHGRLRADIEHFGGTVEKFIGDAVMAVFGAPVAHEDDAERAVRSGLRIIESLAELNAADPTLGLRVRIGINTGEALVSLGARPDLGEGFVAGDVVNTASRIQGAAPIDGVAVSEETQRQTERVFVYEPLPPVDLKGKARPISLFRAIEARARFGSDLIRTHDSPFVGRVAERALLTSLFDRCARDSQVQLVTLVGEPGSGKSRLCAELFAHIDERPELITWRQGRCLPYGDGITFWALGEIVKAQAGIFESDDPDAALAKLDAVLSEHSERAFVRARLLPLIGLEATVPTTREESFSAWRLLIESIAADGPAVLVFEDLHWADPALLDFVAYLAEWAEGVPLLLVCTARPELLEASAAWASGIRNATTINLAPLTSKETEELVIALMARSTEGEDVRQQIVERAGGNPLYAEEFVRLLADRRDDVHADFPDNVHALIAARLDTLPPGRKALLQDASVMGKVFWAGALAEMAGRSLADVLQDLHELSRKELIRPARTSSMEGEAEYAFWHALVRDVAYGQVPRAERARRHEAAAGWIERKAGARSDDLAEVLAHHYLTALDHRRGDSVDETSGLRAAARRHLRLAAARVGELEPAIAEVKLARALELEPMSAAERAALKIRWGRIAFHLGRYREAKAAIDEAIVALRGLGDAESLADALIQRSDMAHYLEEGDPTPFLTEAIAILEAREPGSKLVEAFTEQSRFYWVLGRSIDAASQANRAIDLAADLDMPIPARALGYRGLARAERGDPRGIAEADRAIELLVAGGAGVDAVYMMSNVALLRWLQEGPVNTIALLERALEFAAQRHIESAVQMIENNAVEIQADAGRIAIALAAAEKSVVDAERAGLPWELADAAAWAAYLRLEMGDTQAAHELAERSMAAASRVESVDLQIAVTRTAPTWLAVGDRERALEVVRATVEREGAPGSLFYGVWTPTMVRVALEAGDGQLADRIGATLEPKYPLHEAAAHAAWGTLAESRGDWDNAVRHYDEAVDRYRALGSTRELAWALLGAGRAGSAAGQPAAEERLAASRGLFASFGFSVRVAEVDAALLRATGVAS